MQEKTSMNRLQITKQIYLSDSGISSRNSFKKTAAKPSVSNAILKAKRLVSHNNIGNYKEGASPNNSGNTMIFKQITGSNAQAHHENESTLQLFGQGDGPIQKSEKKLSEIKSKDKFQKGVGMLPAFDNKQKENSITDKIQVLDDNIRKIGTENLVLKSELTKMLACVVRERKIVAESTAKNKQVTLFKNKLEKPTENLQIINDNKSKGPLSFPGSQGASKQEDDSLLEAKVIQPIKNLKIPKQPQLETNLVSLEGHPTEIRKRLFPPTQPLSAKSSARNPVRDAFISSARSFERAVSGERSNSSHILIRKLSDQGNEYFANQTFNSSVNHPASTENPGIKDNKDQLIKVSRNLGVKKLIRQSRGGSTSTGVESSLQTEKLESTQRVTVIESKSESIETIPAILSTMLTRVENVFKQYEASENVLIARNKALLKMLDEKLKTKEGKIKK